MINSHRQRTGIETVAPDEMIVGKPGGLVEPGVKQYGIFKKIKKGVKKIFKSKLGKAALLGLGAYGLGGAGFLGGKGIFAAGQGLQRFRNLANIGSALKSGATRGLFGAATGQGPAGQVMPKAGGLWNWIKGNKGKAAMLGLGAAGAVLPFMGKPLPEEEDDDWLGVDKIRQMARDRHPSLAFLPNENYVQSDWYTNPSPFNQGGIVGLANGGQPAEAQAEQMLKMEYQKYRNQGGTMSYQQFKMAVLQQAQGQGPMAQGQPQRAGYQGGELVEDASMVEATPTGMMEEDVEEVQGEPTREQMEALAMEIFQLRLEELDEEQLMVVYQAAMEQQPREEAVQEEDVQFAANGGRIGFWPGGPAGGASAGGNYGGNVNPQQEYAGRTFQETYGGGGGGDAGNNTADTNLISKKPIVKPDIKEGYNWGNILPGGKPFYASKYLDYENVFGTKYDPITGLPVEGDEENPEGLSPTLGSHLLHKDATARQIEKDAAMAALIAENPDQLKAQGGRVGLLGGGSVPGSIVPGYTTPAGHNQFGYRTGGVRVGKAEGGLMSLGGMEKDYRAEGGFVPIGGKERADDVPARLSKNEFVFTADAVRNAGGGDIDAGAKVMENMMNHLEAGGQISEESQGAQGMYDQQQMLQSRMA